MHQTHQSKTVLTLDDAKRRIAIRTRTGHGIVLEDTQSQDSAPLQEERSFPPFVQHCVSAIATNPETMRRLRAGSPSKKDAASAPYAICRDRYNKSTRSLAASHATGAHHSKSDFKKAIKTLAKLREDLRYSMAPRHRVIFEAASSEEVKGGSRRAVRFTPSEGD